MVVLFLLGYLAIALEHPIKVEKAASALLLGAILWAVYALSSESILAMGLSPSWEELKLMGQQIINNIAPAMTPDQYATSPFRETVELAGHPNAFVKYELAHHLVDIAEILFFLFGAMTIVEVIDQHQGFTVITNKIATKSKVRLIWIIGLDVVIIAGNFYLNQKFVVPNYIILAVFLSDAIIDIVNYDVII